MQPLRLGADQRSVLLVGRPWQKKLTGGQLQAEGEGERGYQSRRAASNSPCN